MSTQKMTERGRAGGSDDDYDPKEEDSEYRDVRPGRDFRRREREERVL